MAYKQNPVSIETRLNPNRGDLIESNRNYFKKLFAYARYFGMQELAARAEGEHGTDGRNRGNWRELMELEFQLHPEFQQLRDFVRRQYSVHTDYLSKTIYNEHIETMADEVRRVIAAEVSESRFYTVIIDECKDISKFEQLSICVRYSGGSKPTERFVGFVHLLGDFSAKAIADQVLAFVHMLSGFDCKLVGLSADGASVMSGNIGGVQKLLKDVHPQMTYVHCLAHRLNLVIVKSLKSICPVLIRIMEQLHHVFGAAKTNETFRAAQTEAGVSVRAVPARSETRWSSMFMVLDLVCDRYREILVTLVNRGNDTDPAADTAAGMYAKLCSGRMIITCATLRTALSYTKMLSDYLQGESVEYHHAIAEIQDTRKFIADLSSEDSVKEILSVAKGISRRCEIPLEVESHVYSLKSYVKGGSSFDAESFTRTLAAKVSKKISSEIDIRYPEEGWNLFEGIDSLNSKSSKYLDWETMRKLVAHFGADFLGINETLLKVEVAKWKRHISGFRDGQKQSLNPALYPQLMKVMCLKRSLPVSSAESERSFSVMKRVKNPYRNRLEDTRMSDLCLLSSEADITRNLNLDELVNIFSKKERRVALR